jgi:hypothetical protein
VLVGIRGSQQKATTLQFDDTLHQRRNELNCSLLADWASGILLEFGINVGRHVLATTSDSGSDVKRALEKVLGIYREWCVSHLIHRALVDAFGADIDGKKSKNKEARDVMTKCRSTVESVNKSDGLKDFVDKHTLELFGHYLKQKNDPAHRWSSFALVLERILLTWPALVSGFRKIGKQFQIADDKEVIAEFYSVIHSVREVQKIAQSMHNCVVIDRYVMLCELITTVLDPMSLL